jgi:hypothetical protein
MGKILRVDLGQEQISEEWLGLAHLIPDLKGRKDEL